MCHCLYIARWLTLSLCAFMTSFFHGLFIDDLFDPSSDRVQCELEMSSCRLTTAEKRASQLSQNRSDIVLFCSVKSERKESQVDSSVHVGWAQSRQSAKLFSSRRNLDSPNPLPAGECAPPPPLVTVGGAHSLAREGVVLFIYMYFVRLSSG